MFSALSIEGKPPDVKHRSKLRNHAHLVRRQKSAQILTNSQNQTIPSNRYNLHQTTQINQDPTCIFHHVKNRRKYVLN